MFMIWSYMHLWVWEYINLSETKADANAEALAQNAQQRFVCNHAASTMAPLSTVLLMVCFILVFLAN